MYFKKKLFIDVNREMLKKGSGPTYTVSVTTLKSGCTLNVLIFMSTNHFKRKNVLKWGGWCKNRTVGDLLTVRIKFCRINKIKLRT